MKVKNFLKAIWELPQNVVGFIVKKACEARCVMVFDDADVYAWDINSGLSLGKYIFVDDIKNVNRVKHEYGHRLQSKKLGWFYLLVIGLPSFLWSWCGNGYRKKTGKSYYGFFTESWADKLGGVNREEEGR